MNTCFNCQERHLGCHDFCSRYQDAVKKNEVIKHNRQMEYIGDYLNMKRRLDVSLAKARLIKSGRKVKGGRKP